MNFWVSPTGNKLTGTPKSAFISDFTTIPEGTTALSTIKKVAIINKPASDYSVATKYIEITHKLADGDFKGREVSQKIKCFDGKPEAIERNLNMLMLVMNLVNYKPTHNNEPTQEDLNNLCGKVVGIKIGEWSLPKNDGGIIDGNFVREVHSAAHFVSETGVKTEVTHSRSSVDSAFSRNQSKGADLSDDLPF